MRAKAERVRYTDMDKKYLIFFIAVVILGSIDHAISQMQRTARENHCLERTGKTCEMLEAGR